MLFLYLLALVPMSMALAYFLPTRPGWVFLAAILAIVPLAEWIRRATEQIARRTGSTVGGLFNVTFGNMAEFVLAMFVLSKGHPDVVKGQITGSFIGNALLGLGVAILVGTWGREKLTFRRERARHLSSLLILAVVGLLVPALYDYTERGVVGQAQSNIMSERLSLCVSVVLVSVYVANLLYTLVTHRDVFARAEHREAPEWTLKTSLAVLAGATVATALEAELVAKSLEATAIQLGLSSFFLGVIVLAIIGNAAEYVAAISFARQNQLGAAMIVTVGSTIQVAILVAPMLVLISYLTEHPMNLVFANPLELIAIAAVAFVVSAIAHDGEATWFEGLLLVSVYVILAFAFFFVIP